MYVSRPMFGRELSKSTEISGIIMTRRYMTLKLMFFKLMIEVGYQLGLSRGWAQ